MREAEFDQFAEEYQAQHVASIRLSGEGPDFFAAYKIADVRRDLSSRGVRPRRILDFGAGVGNSLGPMRAAFPESDIVCLDVSGKSLEIAEHRFPGKAYFKQFDGQTIPFPDGHFDLAFTACVFHHIPGSDHLSLLREIHRVLDKAGNFYLFEHNPLNPLTAKAVRDCPFDENAELIGAHTMRHRIADAGFAGPSVTYRLFFPRMLALLRSTERFLTKFPLGAQYYVHATKRLD